MSKEYTDPFAFAKSLLPTTVGYDSIFKSMEDMHRLARTMTGYPPYNIKKVDENRYAIEMAVAGFGKSDIDIELAGGVLTVKGHLALDTLTEDGTQNVQYFHKGIADRAFNRQFTLSDKMKIHNAELINGMLKIWLESIIPEKNKPQKIEINSEKSSGGSESVKQFLTEKYGDR